MILPTSVSPAQRRHSSHEQSQVDPQHRVPRRVRSGFRAWPVLPAGIAVLLLAWAVVMLVVPDVSFILLDPRTKIGLEVLRAVVSLFAALILVLFPDEAMREQLRWVALAFVLLGLGSLGFGYLYPVLIRPLSLQEGMYASLLVYTAAAAALAAGLALPNTPRLGKRGVFVILAVVAGLGILVLTASSEFFTLTTLEALIEDSRGSTGPLPGLAPAHWVISMVPLLLATIAAIGAIRHYSGTLLGRWLAIAMVLFAGSQLHSMLWPSAYGPVFTTSSILRATFTAVVCAGVILALRAIAAEHAMLLEHEREYTRRLEDLAVLRADFTAMVAHEIASPLSAIRRSVDLLEGPGLPQPQDQAVETIRTEATMLAALVDDVQASARAEREDFAVNPRPVSVAEIVSGVASYGGCLEGGHPVDVQIAATGSVMADPDRIGQVLRNLLSNAAKFSRPGTPITLRVTPVPVGCVRFEVIDRGHGIHPDDMARIFEKFGRGRPPGDDQAMVAPGVGLGLYLSRRIIRASGSELRIRSDPGRETCFWFDLEAVR